MRKEGKITFLKTLAEKGINGIKNLALKSAGKPLKPKGIVFLVTDKCNSRCQHCNIWRKESKNNPLSPGEVAEMFNDPLFQQVEYVINTGGEPILRGDMKEIISIEDSYLTDARIQLSTNGLIPERVLDVVNFALDQNIDIDVGVSLDAIGKKHDRIRGIEGNFKKAEELLRSLTRLREERGERRLSVGVAFLLYDQTIESLQDVKRYVENLNLDLLVQFYDENPFYGNTGKNLFNNENEVLQTLQSLDFSIVYELWMHALKHHLYNFSCFALRNFCVITCDGYVTPCLNLYNHRIGNVRENTPSKIWWSEEAEKGRKIVEKCSGCLNTWGVQWSFQACLYSFIPFFLKNPSSLKRAVDHYLT